MAKSHRKSGKKSRSPRSGMKHKVKALRKLAKKLGLKTSGKKKALLARLRSGGHIAKAHKKSRRPSRKPKCKNGLDKRYKRTRKCRKSKRKSGKSRKCKYGRDRRYKRTRKCRKSRRKSRSARRA